MIAMDVNTQLIYKGVEAISELIRKAQELMKELSANELYREEKDEISLFSTTLLSLPSISRKENFPTNKLQRSM